MRGGFDEFHQGPNDLNDWYKVYKWIDNNHQKKIFLFLHTYKVHDPYIVPSPFDKIYDQNYEGNIIGEEKEFVVKFSEMNPSYKFLSSEKTFDLARNFFWQFVNKSDKADVNHLIALYDSTITCCVDPFIGKLLSKLQEHGIDEKTIVIITSDHGEAFGEHGTFLHEDLHYENLYVPLIVKIPNADRKRIKSQVQSIDIMPTILDTVGIPIPSSAQGKSLLPLIFVETKNIDEYTYGYWFSMSSIRSDKWKLIMHDNNTFELYDMVNDPEEHVNVAERYPNIVNDMEKKLNEFELSRYK